MIGMFSWFGYVLPMEERLSLLRNAGFDATLLWIDAPDDACARALSEDAATARALGLFVENAHAPFDRANDLWGDSAARTTVLASYRRCLSFCAAAGIPTMVLHLNDSDTVPPPGEGGVDALRSLVESAATAKVVLALENTRVTVHLDYVFERIESPFLGFCYDSSHDFLTAGTTGELLRRWGSRLRATHFSDNDGAADRHWLPGDGIGDWSRNCAAFPAAYAGPISLEVAAPLPHARSAEEFVNEAGRRALALQQFLRNPSVSSPF